MSQAHDCEANRRKFGICVACEASGDTGQGALELGEVPCAFRCGEPVNPADSRTWQMQTGWTRPRQQGGTNALALRQPVQLYAHHECIDRARTGHLGQEQLPTLPTEEF